MWEVMAFGEQPYWDMSGRDVSGCGGSSAWPSDLLPSDLRPQLPGLCP